MADVLANWVATLRANLIGIATLRQVAGEPIEFRCSGKILIFMVVAGRYVVKHGDASVGDLERGEIYFVQRQEGEQVQVPPATVSAITDEAVVICASFAGVIPTLQQMMATVPSASIVSSRELRSDPNLAALAAVIGDELQLDACGSNQIGNHLFEALFLLIVRHLSKSSTDIFHLIGHRNDPYVSKVLARMQQAPAHTWTLDELASLAGLSRAAFARRFKADTGETPLKYLKRFRMHIAADMLRHAASVRKTAEHVGYLSEFAFSRAFSSYHGVSPSSYRDV